MTRIRVMESAGVFAEDKDGARELRLTQLLPALNRAEDVTLDFDGIELATQSFIHALISDVIRQFGPKVLERIVFTNCRDEIRSLVSIVSEYSQDTVE